jgi:sialate O-acetylesterase
VAYYFAAALQERLHVPVGLITSTVGGSPIEAWISLDSLRRLPGYAQTTARVHRYGPSALFNGMIGPLAPMTIRGVIWYQGESNVGASSADYAALLRTLVADWRGRFQCKDLPIDIVQLANFGRPTTDAVESKAALVREAQAAVAAEVPGVGLAVAIDLGDVTIHPPNKRDVGRRLALGAMAKTYRLPVPCSGPVYRGMAVEGSAVRLRFENTEGALVAMDGPLRQFFIAGADGKFHRADAVIEHATGSGIGSGSGQGDDTVVVSSPQTPNPVRVRYAWADNPAGCNLYNRAGLPAAPFRTDCPQSRNQ